MRHLLAAALGGGGFTPPIANVSLTPPIRAAYYFPWWPEAWDSGVYTPATHYTPTIGAYHSQYDRDVIVQHMEWAVEANLDALIITWQGRYDGEGVSAAAFPGWPPGDAKLPNIMDIAYEHGLKVCLLYGVDAAAPTVLGRAATQAEITAEITWLTANRFNHRAYLHVDDRPVMFVYTEQDFSNTFTAKYSAATAGYTTAYILMQTATNPAGATNQPDAWFMFNADRTQSTIGSYTILPGFWRYNSETPITTRVLATWQANVASMIASGKDWHLVISFNEWFEGSQIEPSTELGTAYLDALA